MGHDDDDDAVAPDVEIVKRDMMMRRGRRRNNNMASCLSIFGFVFGETLKIERTMILKTLDALIITFPFFVFRELLFY